jgi:tetratricopeptide (TPR) repeat protein
MIRTLSPGTSLLPMGGLVALVVVAVGAFGGRAQAVDILPFDDPPPQFDMSKTPKLRPGGATFVVIDVGRLAAIGPKGTAILKLVPEPPVPPGIESATKGIEIRLGKAEPSEAYQSFTFSGTEPGAPDQIISYLRIAANGQRLAACGFYVVVTTPQHPGKESANYFNDLRSYLAIGDLARLPVNFVRDATQSSARGDGKFSATCVDSNIRWEAVFGAAPLALHLEPKPFTYKWTVDQVIPPGAGQAAQTPAPCSPIVNHARGKISVTFRGGCSSGLTPVQIQAIVDAILSQQGVPLDLLGEFQRVSRRFGVTDAALMSIFKTLGEKQVPPGDLDAKLTEIAARHLSLLKQAEPAPADDAATRALKGKAVAAIGRGDYDGAERLLRQASNDRAEPYKDADHVAEAEPRLKRALAMDEKTLGPEHPVVVADLNNLAVAYQRQGRLAEAESVLKRALAISEKTRGPGYPELSTTLDNLANVYQDQGRLAEAESLFKRALAIDEKALGPEHRSVALKLNNLAMLYNDEGRRAEAVALLKRALAIDEKTLGLEHPTTRAIRDNLRVISDAQAAHPN